MTKPVRKILVTSALPYANGPIHLGHMVEYIQTDIWVRYQRMCGHECVYVCADDAHGTPIMLRAESEGISPEELITQMHALHSQDFADFSIAFDNFHSTHSDENRQLVASIFSRLVDNGHIATKVIKQAYDPEKEMFLPDRFVKGECPKCGTKDQYGDNCEACSATYNPTDLINPISVVSGAIPIEKESEHLFFTISDFQDDLKRWIRAGHIATETANKLDELFEAGLHDWDISRDKPYFGFEIPAHPGKYFYVWLDAPIGYLASLQDLCTRREDLDFDEFLKPDSDCEMVHFIGKDIVRFHALFWPALLSGSGYRRPSKIFVHGFLTVDGLKMSKSRGTFINARAYLDHLNPEYLRYYFATKLTSRVDDLDLNLDDFLLRVNSDLVGKVVNIASRCAGFIQKSYDATLAPQANPSALYQQFCDAGESIGQLYEQREYNPAMRQIMALADLANQYIDEHKPWVLAKQDGKEQEVHEVCSLAINLFKVLIAYLKPVLPTTATEVEKFLNIPALNWHNYTEYLSDHKINKFKPLMTRVESDKITAMLAASKQEKAE
ncbi:MAG: methionine--tRNA ligase, partial [Thiohalomonadales bacterium]